MTPPPWQYEGGGVKNQIFARMALNHFHFHFCQMASRPPFPLLSQIAKKFFFNDEGHLKDILSLTLTLGWKNKKQSSGPIELDLEAGNLVDSKSSFTLFSMSCSVYFVGFLLLMIYLL